MSIREIPSFIDSKVSNVETNPPPSDKSVPPSNNGSVLDANNLAEAGKKLGKLKEPDRTFGTPRTNLWADYAHANVSKSFADKWNQLAEYGTLADLAAAEVANKNGIT